MAKTGAHCEYQSVQIVCYKERKTIIIVGGRCRSQLRRVCDLEHVHGPCHRAENLAARSFFPSVTRA